MARPGHTGGDVGKHAVVAHSFAAEFNETKIADQVAGSLVNGAVCAQPRPTRNFGRFAVAGGIVTERHSIIRPTKAHGVWAKLAVAWIAGKWADRTIRSRSTQKSAVPGV